MIAKPLFEGATVQLTALDPEQDAKVISAWTYDLDISRKLQEGHSRPMSALDVRKRIEALQKEVEDTRKQFLFAVREKASGQLVGILRLYWIEWGHGAGRIDVLIAQAGDRAAVESETLQLGLHFAFNELNLFRLSAGAPEYDYHRIDRLEEAGFVLEVNLRQFLYRAERCWDQLNYGILRSEWERRQKEMQS